MNELLYRIDPVSKSSIRILLEERGAVKKRTLYLSTLKELAREPDRAALQKLVSVRRRASAGFSLETLSFQQIDLEPHEALEALPLLLQTGRLFFQKERMESLLEGKLIWEGESLGCACRLEASIHTTRKIPLTDLSWFFLASSKLAAVVGNDLLLFPFSSSVKWIEMAQKGAFILEEGQKRRFLEEDFFVCWKKKEEIELKVFPQLHLHDAAGCFANLFMEYPGVGVIAMDDPSPFVGTRKRLLDEEKQWEKDLLEAGYLKKRVGRSSYYCPGELASGALSLLFGVGWSIRASSQKQAVSFSDWDCSIEEEDAEIVLRAGERLQKALWALRGGKSWFDEREKTVWIDRQKAARLLGTLPEEDWRDGELRLPKRQLTSCLGLVGTPKVLWQKELKEAIERLSGSKELEHMEIGQDFQGDLMPYQRAGVDWLAFLHRFGFGGLLADEMGLGKTVQILAFFSLLRTNLPVLIVAPTSLVYHWHSEFRRFLPNLKAGVVRSQGACCEGVRFLITSYALLRQSPEMFSDIEFEVVVLDESNAIKNRTTQTAEAALKLRACSKFCLSGTPVENRASELAAQFAFLMPGLIRKSEDVESMQKKCRPFLLRRMKKEVALELPEKIDSIVWVEMEGEQLALYEEFQKGALQKIRPKIEHDGASRHRMEILEAILRLRQICCDPYLVQSRAESAKLACLLNDLEDLVGEEGKALVFSQFTSMLDRIEGVCRSLDCAILRIDGSTDAAERAKIVEEFQMCEGSCILLLSLKAAGVGLNLTAADCVLLFDPWWNEAVERQAIDRAHRIGRKETLLIKRYLTANSIEEKMLGLKETKLKTAGQLLDGGPHDDLPSDELFSLLMR